MPTSGRQDRRDLDHGWICPGRQEFCMLTNAAITGWGRYLPGTVVTNADLAATIDTSDDWILSRTGIRERHVAAPGESTSTMGVEAARQALERAGLAAEDVDLVLCATTTPDHLVPATACLIQREIGATRAGAFDINAACSGMLTAINVGTQFIRCGSAERVLVVGGETLSRFVNWRDRSTCVLFGDGASAVVLEPTFHDWGVLSTVLGSHGDRERMLTIEAGGSARPASAETVASGAHHIRMRGNEVFKLAVRSMKEAALKALAQARLDLRDIRVVLPHQANERIITAIQEALGMERHRVFVNVDQFANTGAASVGIALDDLQAKTPLATGDHVLLVAFGGGLTWAASVIRWADLAVVREERQESLAARLVFPRRAGQPVFSVAS